MATHSSIFAWRIQGMEEPGGLPSMGSHSVRHEWSDLAAEAAAGFGALELSCNIEVRGLADSLWCAVDKHLFWTTAFREEAWLVIFAYILSAYEMCWNPRDSWDPIESEQKIDDFYDLIIGPSKEIIGITEMKFHILTRCFQDKIGAVIFQTEIAGEKFLSRQEG